MAPMGKGRGQGVTGTGIKSALGLFLLEVYDAQSSGQQMPGWTLYLLEASLKPP